MNRFIAASYCVKLVMISTSTIERRQGARAETLANEIVLQWWEFTETRTSEAKLLDVSERGVLVVSDSLVPFIENIDGMLG